MTPAVASAELRALFGDSAANRKLWLELWSAWHEREVWAHPVFLDQFRKEGERAMCLHWRRGEKQVLFPLLLRPIPVELSNGRELLDATGPYGYGGAFVLGEADAEDAKSFWLAVKQWADDHRVLTIFSRQSVFPEQLMCNSPGTEEVGSNVVCELQRSDEAIWSGYEHKVRKNVNRARREGVTVEVDRSAANLDSFRRIYLATMDRREAAESFYFKSRWFERLFDELTGHAIFFHALYHCEVVSTELVLASRSHLYSFLGGTDALHFEKRPNDLLKHEIIEWGKHHGYTHYLLGGGFLSGNAAGYDGILRYKRSFSPAGIVPFRVMKWVLDQDLCRQLVERRAANEKQRGMTWIPRADFFPPYRS